jgi:hypothetical protein
MHIHYVIDDRVSEINKRQKRLMEYEDDNEVAGVGGSVCFSLFRRPTILRRRK